MARTPSQKEIAAFIVGHGIVDFVSGGKLSLVERNALWKAVKKLGPVTARAAPRVGMTAVQVGKQVALRHPVLTGGAIAYYTYKNRDEIADLIEQGYDVIQDANIGQNIDPSRFVPAVQSEFSRLMTEGPRPSPGRVPPGFLEKPKRRKSTYNLAVSKGLNALKKSTSYGKKGVLSTPKKAFGFVARTVSKLRKGKKVPSKGASGVVKRSLGNIKITVRKP